MPSLTFLGVVLSSMGNTLCVVSFFILKNALKRVKVILYNMYEIIRSPEESERNRILEVLECALEQGVMAELTISGPLRELRSGRVFVEGIEEHVVYVSDSDESSVMPLLLSDIKDAKLINQE